MISQVSLVKCEDYTPSMVLRAVKEAVDLLGGISRFVTNGNNVLVKPNLLSAHAPESAVCTHPSVVEAVLGLALAAGGHCVVGDGPAIMGETPAGYARLLETTGMRTVLERNGVQSVRFDEGFIERGDFGGRVFRQFPIAKAVDSADVLINLPKFKTHSLTGITGAVKNLYGCLPVRRKIEFHLQAGDNPEMFAQIIVDVARTVRPNLSIMDAIVGMDGQGPSAGRVRKFGFILTSTDPVALDSVACIIAGIDPLSIHTLRLASEQEIGTADIESIEILGETTESVCIENFELPTRENLEKRIPKPIYRALKNQFTKKPVFIRKKCTGCGTCVSICPTKVISGEKNRLKIDYSKCIRCYCCQEVCPKKAIRVRPGPLRSTMELFRRKKDST